MSALPEQPPRAADVPEAVRNALVDLFSSAHCCAVDTVRGNPQAAESERQCAAASHRLLFAIATAIREAREQGAAHTARLSSFLHDVLAERAAQDEHWGGPEHDDEHLALEWRTYRDKQEQRIDDLTRWSTGLRVPPSAIPEARKRLIKIAALAVAQIESLDRQIALDAARAAAPEPPVTREDG